MNAPATFAPRRALLALLGLLVTAGCATQRVGSGADPMAGMAPMLSVERFLQATNARDYQSMSRLFGTRDGPVAETGGGSCGAFSKMFGGCADAAEVERWMAAIAQVLRYDDYKVVSQRQEPGRQHPTQRIGVDLTVGSTVVPDVAFVVVQGEDGGWLVESVDLEKITGA